MTFTLRPDAIHLWKFRWADWEESLLNRMRDTLPEHEQQEADRYRMANDLRRFCIGRAMLRHLSGRYLGVDGGTLAMERNEHGKPRWINLAAPLHFNISHSGDWVVMAFSRNHELGIDVQQHKQNKYFKRHSVAEQEFHPQERAAMDSLLPDAAEAMFFSLWAAKESVIKAIGLGLYTPLQAFSTAPLPAIGEWRELALEDGVALTALQIDSAHAGALAVRGKAQRLTLHQRDFADAGFVV